MSLRKEYTLGTYVWVLLSLLALDTTKDWHSHDLGQYLGRKVVRHDLNKITIQDLNIRIRMKTLILRCT